MIQVCIALAMALGAETPVFSHFSSAPLPDDFVARRAMWLEQLQDAGEGAWSALAKLQAGGIADEGPFYAVCDDLDVKDDCDDFSMFPLLRLLCQFGPKVSPELAARAKQALLEGKYWPDEGGADSMCTWSENHQFAYCVDAYLAGQLYPEDTFSRANHTGREKMARFLPRIERWLEFRFRTGFSEWLSNDYYSLDIASLALLMDFAADEALANRAAMVLDTMLADMALNSFRGMFSATHGRSYEEDKKFARREHTTAIGWLAFGMGWPKGSKTGAASLALSPTFQMPAVLEAIARDTEREELVVRQRMGIRVADAAKWGLRYDNFEDGMVFLSLEAYCHPKVINLTMDMFDAYRWWENDFFRSFAKNRDMIETARKTGALPMAAEMFAKDLGRNTREEVNFYTYKTPDYMLSTAQDWRKGYGGDQQHVWQATLGVNAVCFTTHPARENSQKSSGNDTPDYWAGSGTLPRAAQYRNVAVAMYDIDTTPGLYLTNELFFTHAWLPRDQFDEVVERGGWIFARKDAGYLALRSMQPYRWQTDGPDKDAELIADGKRNVWICELGREAKDGAFAAFIERIIGAGLHFGDLEVTYTSPSQGQIEFGWNGPLKVNGAEVQLDNYDRYDAPFAHARFPSDTIRFRHGEDWLLLDWKRGVRLAGGHGTLP